MKRTRSSPSETGCPWTSPGPWQRFCSIQETTSGPSVRSYDPRYLERSAELVDQRLPDSLIFPVEPSSRLMRDALQTFFRLVHEGTLRHRGDPVIAAHLANCAVERGFRDRSVASARSTSASRSTPF